MCGLRPVSSSSRPKGLTAHSPSEVLASSGCFVPRVLWMQESAGVAESIQALLGSACCVRQEAWRDDHRPSLSWLPVIPSALPCSPLKSPCSYFGGTDSGSPSDAVQDTQQVEQCSWSWRLQRSALRLAVARLALSEMQTRMSGWRRVQGCCGAV